MRCLGTGAGLFVWVPSCPVLPSYSPSNTFFLSRSQCTGSTIAPSGCTRYPTPCFWPTLQRLRKWTLRAAAASIRYAIIVRLHVGERMSACNAQAAMHHLFQLPTQGSLLDGTFSRLWPVSLRGEVVQCGADSAP